MKPSKTKLVVVLTALCVAIGVTAFAAKHEDKKVDLPEAVLNVVKEICPDGVMEEVECEEEGIAVYEVEIENTTGEIELTVAPDGTVIEKETEIGFDALPEAVKSEIAKLGTDAVMEEVKEETQYYVSKLEKLEAPKITYEVELEKDGIEMVIEYAIDGQILEKKICDDDDDDERDGEHKGHKDDDDNDDD